VLCAAGVQCLPPQRPSAACPRFMLCARCWASLSRAPLEVRRRPRFQDAQDLMAARVSAGKATSSLLRTASGAYFMGFSIHVGLQGKAAQVVQG